MTELAHASTLLAEQTSHARNDVAQMAALLDDAIARLGEVFDALAALTATLPESGDVPSAKDWPALRGEVQQQAARAIQALQFHDLARQVLMRLDARHAGFAELAVILADPARAAALAPLAERFDMLSHRTVVQTNLAGGDIELF
ncbi:hypothetical protein [Chitinolyticbacter meiyuanensis]|uniref:hypothetical protein n=1 Tax=Chitinolyticbacter meiyuanensis TaxID=682798 RepID=UPI0011E58D31|nr:hypothetical protein [Chitinolyticbacter meiyuanensis]